MEFDKTLRTQRTIRIRQDAIDVADQIAELNDVSFSRVIEQMLLSFGQPYLESKDADHQAE